jgi:hypothetical protein
MGVDPSTFNLDNVDCLKDLEIARHSINQKLEEKYSIPLEQKPHSPLLLGFGEMILIMKILPLFCLKKSKKRIRSAIKVTLRKQQLRETDKSGGAQAKSCAASVKAHKYHPESDIVAGSRVRRRNPKYL